MAETGYSLPQFIKNNSLFWDTPNFVANKIVESDSGNSNCKQKPSKL